MIVEAKRTPISDRGIVDELKQQFEGLFGRRPNARELAILATHVGVETADGAAMWHHNFGNITTRPSSGGRMFTLEGDEGPGTGSDAPEHYYVAYDSFADGARAFLELLARRYGSALSAAEAGQSVAYVDRLKERHYFEAPLGVYQQAFADRLNRYLPLVDEGGSAVSPFGWPFLRGLPWERGDSGVMVRALQGELAKRGAELVTDGVYGPRTEGALEAHLGDRATVKLRVSALEVSIDAGD